MRSCIVPLCAIFLSCVITKTEAGLLDGVEDAFEKADVTLSNEIKTLRKSTTALYRQVMLQQLFLEERIRSDGDSGVKQVRINRDGTKNYHSDSHTSANRVLAIHDHANNIRTIGMGEFIGVLNGVEFRTRHNDYRLNMPHRNSSKWHATEPIPFPDVPPEVLSKTTINEQIVEMREWFNAWRDQNTTIRDYRKYFKPVLCYLEGAWTTSTNGKVDEPFESDRHFINAKNWFDLQQKIRFTSYTGRKDRQENLAFLPTTIMNIINESIPQFAQWNYRILCHPISRDVPLNRFRVVDELQSRMAAKRTYTAHSATRAARFQLNPSDQDQWKDRAYSNKWGLLDELMNEIPGKENYQGNLTDEALGSAAYTLDPDKSGKVNAAFYHRKFKVVRRGAMGLQTRRRGFSDPNLFMAKTTHPNVAGLTLTTCKWRKILGKWKKVCTYDHQKWSYAIPLEIMYMTPLNKWNPYDLEYKGDARSPEGKTVTAGNRWGGKTPEKAYNGTHSKLYYRTPDSFFKGREVESDAADTTRKWAVGVLDRNETVRLTRASGTRIFFPPIDGVGTLRQRYPIMPVHGEGASVWKELEALEDIVMMSQTNAYMFREALTAAKPGDSGPVVVIKPLRLLVTQSTSNSVTPHTHEITLTPEQVENLKNGDQVTVVTNTAEMHQHWVTLRWDNDKGSSTFGWLITKCGNTVVTNSATTACWDRHGKMAVQINH